MYTIYEDNGKQPNTDFLSRLTGNLEIAKLLRYNTSGF
ncbi:hypothetical protein URH17368_2040 [Alicyclobacillus hesperidum URH17-3-68]|nr:hypothetical protein URH17368_2040 [Alicyclobacillus hesperidum URH17-3-68]